MRKKINTQKVITKLKKDGFVKIPNFLSQKEVQQYISILSKNKSKIAQNKLFHKKAKLIPNLHLKHKKFYELIDLGFCDTYRYFNKDKQEYTFWDYMSGAWQKNNGMRIDHFLVSNNLLENVKSININKKPRSELKPSDHIPLELEIN